MEPSIPTATLLGATDNSHGGKQALELWLVKQDSWILFSRVSTYLCLVLPQEQEANAGQLEVQG